MKLHRRSSTEEDTDAWLITFADMVTLLLCFFILMFALAVPSGEKLEHLSKVLKEQGFYNDAGVITDPYETLKEDLSLALGASGYSDEIVISEQKDAVELELASGAFFVSGNAKFSPQAVPMLELLAEKIIPFAKKDIVIEVEGHTDDNPIATKQFPSNWELSASRASNVVRFLAAKGFPVQKLRAVGLGDSQPKAPNRDATGNPLPANQELNRRVVVKLKKAQ